MNREVANNFKIAYGVFLYLVIFYQLFVLRNSPNYNLLNYVSYFTVLSNLFVALVFIYSGLKNDIYDKGVAMARGSSTFYITATGLGFLVFLGGENESLLPIVNIFLHYITPMVSFFDWSLFKNDYNITFLDSLTWIIPPIVYVLYVFVRGYFIGWYPYDFLSPVHNDFVSMVFSLLSILCLSVVLIFLLYIISKVEKNIYDQK